MNWYSFPFKITCWKICRRASHALVVLWVSQLMVAIIPRTGRFSTPLDQPTPPQFWGNARWAPIKLWVTPLSGHLALINVNLRISRPTKSTKPQTMNTHRRLWTAGTATKDTTAKAVTLARLTSSTLCWVIWSKNEAPLLIDVSWR